MKERTLLLSGAVGAIAISLMVLREPPRDHRIPSATPVRQTISRHGLVDASWIDAFTAATGEAQDRMLRELGTGLPERDSRIATLMALVRTSGPVMRQVLFDTLAHEHPVEIAEELRWLLSQESDPDVACAIIDGLCAATMPDHDAPVREQQMIQAFEQAQSAILSELSRPDPEQIRRQAAIHAVVEVFPLDQAEGMLKEALAATNDPKDQDFLTGLIWELMVGSSPADGVDELMAFLTAHPHVLDAEERKAATLAQIEVSAVSDAPLPDWKALLGTLRPIPTADGSFCRWFEHYGKRGYATRDEMLGILQASHPLDIASLLHYGGPGWAVEFSSAKTPAWRECLHRAAMDSVDQEQREFLNEAMNFLGKDHQ